MANTQDYIDYLNDQIDIAPANSQEELRAAQCLAYLFDAHGLEPTTQEFDVSSTGVLSVGILMVVLFVGALFAGMGSMGLTAVGVLLALGAATLLIMRYMGKDVLGKYGPVARSQNVIAFHGATGELAAKGNRPIVVVAHYDTPHEELFNNPVLAPYQALLKRASVICVPIVMLFSLFQFFGFIPSAARRVMWLVAILASIPLLIWGVSIIARNFTGCTPGANDNKAALAAMLSILNKVRPIEGEDVPSSGRDLRKPSVVRASYDEEFAAPYDDSAPGSAVDEYSVAYQDTTEEAIYGSEPQVRGDAPYAAAGVVRHGEETLASLGVLPEECEIVYEAEVGRIVVPDYSVPAEEVYSEEAEYYEEETISEEYLDEDVYHSVSIGEVEEAPAFLEAPIHAIGSVVEFFKGLASKASGDGGPDAEGSDAEELQELEELAEDGEFEEALVVEESMESEVPLDVESEYETEPEPQDEAAETAQPEETESTADEELQDEPTENAEDVAQVSEEPEEISEADATIVAEVPAIETSEAPATQSEEADELVAEEISDAPSAVPAETQAETEDSLEPAPEDSSEQPAEPQEVDLGATTVAAPISQLNMRIPEVGDVDQAVQLEQGGRSSASRRAILSDLPDPSQREVDPFETTDEHKALDIAEEEKKAALAGETVVMQPSTVRIDTDNTVDTVQEELDVISPTDIAEIRPQRRRRRGLFGFRKKDKSDESSMSDWLGVDNDYDAKKDGRNIGSWQNFEKDESEPEDESKGPWKGGATENGRFRVIEGSSTEEAENAELPEGEEEATTESAGRQTSIPASYEPEDGSVEEQAAEDRGAPSEEELRDAVLSMGDDLLISHDIWFVAAGASGLGNAGIKAFLAEYRKACRGAFLVNLDCIGAGQLTVLTNEGLDNNRRADRRLVRLLTETAGDLHIDLDHMTMNWGDTDATPAMRTSMRSATIMGVDENGLPALSCSHDDVPEAIDEHQVDSVAALITEMIRRS